MKKRAKVLYITKHLAKAPQEYQKFITDIRSSQEKFPLKDALKLVKYQTVVNQVVFLSPMFDQSNQAKSEEERKMLLEMPRIIILIPQGLS